MTIDKATRVLAWFYPSATVSHNYSLADYMQANGLKSVRHKAIYRRNGIVVAWVLLHPKTNAIVWHINKQADFSKVGACKFVEVLCTEAGIKYQQYLTMKARGEI